MAASQIQAAYLVARVLFVWELGKGFGHLTRYVPLVKGLLARGHQVLYATRDVGNTEMLFGKLDVPILQAPIMMHQVVDPYRVQHNLSHLIHNTGFGDTMSLTGLVKAWRRIYDEVKPDLCIYDHSPTAMLAARGYRWKRIAGGSGFAIPPPGVPLPPMRYWEKYDQKKLMEEEGRLLANMNGVLETVGAPKLASVSELYDVDELLLFGFQELDQYPRRPNGRYLGLFNAPGRGAVPEWPKGAERKVFAYLHPYKAITALLELLSRGKFASLVYAPEVANQIKKKYANERLRFSEQPLDLHLVAKDCNFAITNGTSGTTSGFLLQGVPVLCIPTVLERVMVTRRVISLGAGVGVEQRKPEKIAGALRALFHDEKYRVAARKFRDKYAHTSLEWQEREAIAIVEGVLKGARAGAAGKAAAAR